MNNENTLADKDDLALIAKLENNDIYRRDNEHRYKTISTTQKKMKAFGLCESDFF